MNMDMEKALLGICFKSKKTFEADFYKRIESKHFSNEFNSMFYQALERVYTSGDSVEFDEPIVSAEIAKIAVEREILNFSRESILEGISEIIYSSGIPSNAEKYSKELLNGYQKRQIDLKIKEIQKHLFDGSNIEDIYEDLTSFSNNLREEGAESFGENPSDYFNERLKLILDLKGTPTGFLTGWKVFDDVLNGIEPKTVTVVAARPSMGKTAFGVNLGYNLSKLGTKTLIFSAEMDAQDISQRFLPFETGIGTRYNTNYKYLKEDSRRLEVVKWGSEKLSKLPLLIDDKAGLTIEDIEWRLVNYVEQGYKVIIIDYIQFIGVRNPAYKNKKQHEQITYIMSKLKTLAKKYNIAIVALAQINRTFEKESGNGNNRPQLSDIKGSGSIEENADKVIALHRPYFFLKVANDENRAKRENKIQPLEIFVLKNRNGTTKDIMFDYLMDYNKFNEADEETVENPRGHVPIMSYKSYLELTSMWFEKKYKEMQSELGNDKKQSPEVIEDMIYDQTRKEIEDEEKNNNRN